MQVSTFILNLYNQGMNKEIERYTLVLEYEESFQKKVNRLVSHGYVPVGGVSICQYGRGTKVAQSFVKYKKEEE